MDTGAPSRPDDLAAKPAEVDRQTVRGKTTVCLRWPNQFGEPGVPFDAKLGVEIDGARLVGRGRIIPFGDHCRVARDIYAVAGEPLYLDGAEERRVRDLILEDALPQIRAAVTSGGATAIFAAGCGFSKYSVAKTRPRGGRSRRTRLELAAWAALRVNYPNVTDNAAAERVIAEHGLTQKRRTVGDAFAEARRAGHIFERVTHWSRDPARRSRDQVQVIQVLSDDAKALLAGRDPVKIVRR